MINLTALIIVEFIVGFLCLDNSRRNPDEKLSILFLIASIVAFCLGVLLIVFNWGRF